MRRQDVTLPPDRGWQWTSDWQVGAICVLVASVPFTLILSQWKTSDSLKRISVSCTSACASFALPYGGAYCQLNSARLVEPAA